MRGMRRVRGGLTLALIVLLSWDARGQVFSKHVVVSQEGHASDVGRDVMRKGETRSTRRWPRRLRWR